MLAWTIYISFAGALVLALLPKGNAALARCDCARSLRQRDSLLRLPVSLRGQGRDAITIVDVPGFPRWASITCSRRTASAGCSCCLPDLPPLPAFSSVGISNVRTNEFFAFFLALIGGVYGVFLSFDLFLLFVFYEIAIVPKYFLIAIWGSTRREYAAMKLALYSFVGSAMVLPRSATSASWMSGFLLPADVSSNLIMPSLRSRCPARCAYPLTWH